MYHEGELVLFLIEAQGTSLDPQRGSVNSVISPGVIGVIMGWDSRFGYEVLVGDSLVYHIDCDDLTSLGAGE